MQLMRGLILVFWFFTAVVLIAAVKLVSCQFGNGLDSCGILPYLALLLGVLAVVGTFPFFLADLADQNARPEGTE